MTSGGAAASLCLVAPADGRASFMDSWAAIAAAAGYAVTPGRHPEPGAEPVDLLLIEGPVPDIVPAARQFYLVDDGSSGAELASRLRHFPGSAVLCCDADRRSLLSGQGLAARSLAPGLQAWRWARPVRPPDRTGRIVVATDASAGRLAGLASLPLPGPANAYASSVQAVVLCSPDQHLFHALTALATGLPLVLPPGGLRWLGPLAALRCTVDEAPAELKRLGSDPSAWFDQVEEGRAALKRVASPQRFLEDLARLFHEGGQLPMGASGMRNE